MKRRSLSFKLITGGLFLALLPMALVGFVAVWNSSNALEEIAQGQAKYLAKNIANMVQEVLSDEAKAAEEIATNPLVAKVAEDSGQDEAAAAELNNWLYTAFKDYREDYESNFLLDSSGKVVADSVNGKSRGLDLAHRDYFKTVMGGQAVISPPIKSKSSGRPVIVAAAPVRNAGGKTVGVYLNVIVTTNLSSTVTQTKIGETGYPWMIDKTGLVVAHPNSEHILNTNLHNLPDMQRITSRMMKGEEGVDTYVFKGDHKVCGFAFVPATGWSVGFTQNTDEFMAPVNHIRNLTLIIAGAVLLLTAFGVYFFARSITKPVIAAVDQLNKGSDQVAAASSQVASAGQSLAEGTSEQAASLEETSASLEELTSMTKQNADNASQADSLMVNVRSMAESANSTMSELLGSMNEINDAGQEINKIIKSIDEIAFQTNLLALNAAVEAARAGEAGAGFAVVADEVRNLAMRAAEAARSTSDLITGVNEKISHGTNLATQMDEAFSNVTGNANKVAELVAEISAASNEQSQGITQINDAVSEMDRVTQTTAANAEESAAAAEELNSQAASMHDIATTLTMVITGGTTIEGSSAQLTQATAPQRALPEPPKARAPKVASGVVANKAAAKNPSQAIPFDDEDFQDF